MKNFFFLSFLILFISCPKADEIPDNSDNLDNIDRIVMTDGPYIFYKNSGDELVYVETNMTSNKLIINKTEIPSDRRFLTKIYSASNEQFQVQLQDNIESPPTVYSQPEKLIAISDIEGNFYALTKVLIGNDIINSNFQWTFGNGHLVFVGDMFDRGYNVTACLWLLYELETQAKKQGGMVHMIMGNHEEMNLNGDDRYVDPKYTKLASELQIEYKELFGEDTELGRWLRTRNCIEKIGNTIYVHGGLSQKMADTNLSIHDINQIAKEFYDKSSEERNENSNVRTIFTNDGPFWYRGYFRDNLSQNDIDKIATYYDTEHFVVGHTVVDYISSLYNEKVIAIDLKQPTFPKEGKAKALYMEGGIFYKVDEDGKRDLL